MISGGGTTLIDSGASLSVASVFQDTLTVQNGATLTIRPIAGGPLGSESTAVPEPSLFILIAGAFVLPAFSWAKKAKKMLSGRA